MLALGSSSTANATAAKSDTIGGLGVVASAETVIQKPGVVWSGGGDRLAAVIPEAKVWFKGGKSNLLRVRFEVGHKPVILARTCTSCKLGSSTRSAAIGQPLSLC